MIIQFKKEEHKPSTLSCIREDGSMTWTKLNPTIEIHDLAHYIVETELGFQNAFYGLIKKGYDIQDFERSPEFRPEELLPKNLPMESLQTEHLVNLIQVHFQSELKACNLLTQLETILSDAGLSPIPELNEDTLQSIIKKVQVLFTRWIQLANNEKIELYF